MTQTHSTVAGSRRLSTGVARLLYVYFAASVIALQWSGLPGLYGMLSAGGYLLVRKRSAVPAKAAQVVLLPLAIGLTIVAVTVASMNLALEWSPRSLDEAMLSHAEDFVHRTVAGMPSYLKLSSQTQAIVLYTLYFLAFCLAAWKPVSRFLEVKKWAGRALASATIVSSFSVFTHDSVAGALQTTADTRIRARYTASQRREGDALNRYLAARTLIQVLGRDGAAAYLRALVAETASTPLQDEPATHLVAYLGKTLVYGETAGDVPLWRGSKPSIFEATPDPWRPPPAAVPQADKTVVVVPPDARAFVEEQRTREATAVALAHSEQEKAIQTLLGDTAGEATGRVMEIAGALVRSLVDCQEHFFAEQSVKYLAQVLDNALVEPVVERAARGLQLRIEQVSERRSATEAARTSTVSGLTDLTVRIPAEYFRIAGEQAQQYLRYSFLSVPHDQPAVILLHRYSIKARELVSAFAPATTEYKVDVTPVLAQAERVMPEVREALRDNSLRRQFEMEVARMRVEVETIRTGRRGRRR